MSALLLSALLGRCCQSAFDFIFYSVVYYFGKCRLIFDFYQHFTRSDARFYNRPAFRTFHLYIIALFSLHQLMPAFRTIYIFHLSHFLSIRFLLLTKHLTPIFSLRLICSRILHWSFLLIFPIVCLKTRTYVRFFLYYTSFFLFCQENMDYFSIIISYRLVQSLKLFSHKKPRFCCYTN